MGLKIYSLKELSVEQLTKDFIGVEVAGREMLNVIRIQESFYCMRYKNG